MLGMPCQYGGSLRQVVITPDAESDPPDAGCHSLAATRYGGSLEQGARRTIRDNPLRLAMARTTACRNSPRLVAHCGSPWLITKVRHDPLRLVATRYPFKGAAFSTMSMSSCWEWTPSFA